MLPFVALALVCGACSKSDEKKSQPATTTARSSTVGSSTTRAGGNCTVTGSVNGPVTAALDGVPASSTVNPPAPGEPIATYTATSGDVLVDVYVFEDRGAGIVRTSGGSWSGNGSSSGSYEASPDGKSAVVDATLQGAGDPVQLVATFACT